MEHPTISQISMATTQSCQPSKKSTFGSLLIPLSQSEDLLNVFRVGVSCRNLYSFVVYLLVSGSGSITSVGEERANLSAVVYL